MRTFRGLSRGEVIERLTRGAWIGFYFVALICAGFNLGLFVAKHYRAKTTGCKPCELAASAPKPVAPGMGVSNP